MKPKERLIQLLFEENWSASEIILSTHKHENFFLEDVASTLAGFGSVPTLPKALEWVMNQGVDPLCINHGNGLFHDAVINGWDYKVVKEVMGVLKKNGCDIECKIKSSPDPRDVAVAAAMAQMYPMEGGSDLGQTPLLSTAKWGQYASLKALLELGANPNTKDDQGFHFLDIYRVWMSKAANGDVDSACLNFWIETQTGHDQMVHQMSNPLYQTSFLEHRPVATQKWLAMHEKKSLDKELTSGLATTFTHRL